MTGTFKASEFKRKTIKWAGRVVRRALAKGIIQKPEICEACGKKTPLEAAHEDYGMPLDVTWLCRRCHILWDVRRPKMLSGIPFSEWDA